MKKPPIFRSNNTIVFPNLDRATCYSSFQRAIFDGTKRGYQDFILDFGAVERIFPNAAVPVAAYLDMYRGEGLDLTPKGASPFIAASRMLNPLTLGSATHRETSEPFSKVWKFQESAEVAKLVDCLVDSLASSQVCAKGVLDGLEWCLNEVMDNVLQHSDGSAGFMMVQVHPTSHRLAVCIADHGQGIFNSLAPSKHKPLRALDAITLAIKQGVTRDPEVGQGNGLWGLSEIVRLNTGGLNLVSGSAALFFDGNQARSLDHLPENRERPGASIDFQINTDKQIDVSDALRAGVKGGTYTHVSLRLESLENDRGEHQINIQSVAHGTGTRRSGAAVRTQTLNVLQEGASRVIVDFEGTGMISSSFADELIGKLVVELGFSGYCQRIVVRNANQTIQSLIDHSVMQRLATQASSPEVRAR